MSGCRPEEIEGTRVGRPRPDVRRQLDDLAQAVEDVADRRPAEDVDVAATLQAPAQDPVDVEAWDPDAEVAAGVGLRRADLLAPPAPGQEPAVRPASREVAEQVHVRVPDVDGRPRHAPGVSRHGVRPDDPTADPAEEEQGRIDLEVDLLRDLRDAAAGERLGGDVGQRGQTHGLALAERLQIGTEGHLRGPLLAPTVRAVRRGRATRGCRCATCGGGLRGLLAVSHDPIPQRAGHSRPTGTRCRPALRRWEHVSRLAGVSAGRTKDAAAGPMTGPRRYCW